MMIQRVILAEYENRCENRPGAKRQREIVNNGKALSPNRFPCGDYFGIVLSERSLKGSCGCRCLPRLSISTATLLEGD
jgi:hypothetical protein